MPVGSQIPVETVSNVGVVWVRLAAADRESGMKWRVMVELIGNDGTVHAHEVNAGGSNTAECSAETVGLTLADGKRTLAGLQDHLVQAQDAGILPPTAALLSLRVSTAAQGCSGAAAVVGVWNGGGAGTALFALPVRGDPAAYGQSRRRDHSRSMHARIRAYRREDGVLASVCPGSEH